MKILIAPWGNFKQWEEVEYRISLDGKEDFHRSKTSLSLLQRVIEPDKTLVVVSDTLYEALEGGEPSSYGEIIESVKNRTQNWINEQEINAKVLVLPGVWKGIRLSFEGSMTDFYYTALWNLSQEITSELLKSNDDSVEFFLDLTHGVNFMPVLIRETLKQIGAVISLIYNVKLVTFNSDPFDRKNYTGPLMIHEIEDQPIEPYFSYSRLTKSGRFLGVYQAASRVEKERYGKLTSDRIREFLNENPVDFEELDCFMISILNVFPLGIFTFFPENLEILKGFVEFLCEFYRENVLVTPEKVLRILSFERKFESLIKILIASEILKDNGISRKGEICIAKLETIDDLIRFNETRKIIANSELSKLKTELLNYPGGWMGVHVIYGKEEVQTIDKRNFIAHAGFEGNATEISFDGVLRYKPNRLDEIKNVIISSYS